MMKSNQLLATFVGVAFAIVFQSLPAKAFNLVYSPNSINNLKVAEYTTTVGNKGKVYVDELQKIDPPSSKLLEAFKNQFPSGWEFEASYTPIYGDFVVNEYKACPPNSCQDIGPSVGGLLNLDYVPRSFGFDPQLGREVIDFPDPDTGKVRWVQWVTDNHKLNGRHGESESILDTTTNTPYYYAGSELANRDTPYEFYDNSGRTDIGEDHDWVANLYLAYEKPGSSSNSRKVQIFGGVSWDWHNEVKRKKKEPDPNPPFCSIYEGNNSNGDNCKPKIDLEFLFDTTGSMGSSIGSVQTAAKDILNQLDTSGADYRIAVADYKDFPEQGGYPYRADLPFSTDKTAITSSINSLSSNIWGGGDTPESAYSGLIRTINTEGLGSWRDGAKRSVVIMTDAPPHDPEPHTGYTSKDVVDAAYAMGVSFNLQNWNAITANDAVYPVSIYSIIPGGDSSATYYFSKISGQIGGKLYTTNSSEDIANALLDITDDITNTTDNATDKTPQSVPEPSPVMGLWTVVFAGLGLSR